MPNIFRKAWDRIQGRHEPAAPHPISPVPEVVRYFSEALDEAYRNGVIERDIAVYVNGDFVDRMMSHAEPELERVRESLTEYALNSVRIPDELLSIRPRPINERATAPRSFYDPILRDRYRVTNPFDEIRGQSCTDVAMYEQWPDPPEPDLFFIDTLMNVRNGDQILYYNPNTCSKPIMCKFFWLDDRSTFIADGNRNRFFVRAALNASEHIIDHAEYFMVPIKGLDK